MSRFPEDNIQKSGITEFTTVNSVTLSSSGQQIDKNKFLMKDNVFDQNFAGYTSSIVTLQGIRRVHISGDIYQHNTGSFAEALNSYGSIQTSGVSTYDSDDNVIAPGAFTLGAYYIDQDDPTSLLSQLDDNTNSLKSYYPNGIIEIRGSFYISISDTTFDDNYFQELDISKVTDYYRSLALTLRMWQGEIHLESLTIQNYQGWDLGKLETILGASNYSNVIQKKPEERDQNGDSIDAINTPNYLIDYAFKNKLIHFANPTTETDSDFQNYFDSVDVTSLSVSNITYYDPGVSTSFLLDVSDDAFEMTITDILIDDVDMIKGLIPMISLQPLGTLTMTGGTISNINKDAYNLDTSNYGYASSNGAVFLVNSFKKNNNYGTLSYTFEDLIIENIYWIKGGVFYFSDDSSTSTAHDVNLTITNTTFQNNYSFTRGIIYSLDSELQITLSNCTFTSNTGVNGEADLYYKLAGSFQISDTTFTKFSSSATGAIGQSISLVMTSPFNVPLKLVNVKIKCSETAFDADNYVIYVSDTSTYFTKASPIAIGPGDLETTTWTFSNWFTAENGGVINSDTNSFYTDNGSTFTQNAAETGGAIYTTKTGLSLTGTIFSYNYADTGGAITLDGDSTASPFTDVSCTFNYVASNGACIYAISSSTYVLKDSTITNNYSLDIGGAIYALGTSTSTITNTTFSDNTAEEGNIIALLFARTTFTNITLKNNIAYAESSGIFVTFSIVTISDSTFTTTSYPFGATTINEAVSQTYTSGCFVSISAGATVTIDDTEFSNGFAINGGFIYVSGNSELTLSDSTLTSGYAQTSGGAIYSSNHKSLTLSGCTFSDNIAFESGSDMYLSSGSTTVTSMTFNVYPNYNSIYVTGGNLTVMSLTFTNSDIFSSAYSDSIQGGGIYASNLNRFYMTSSKFENLNYAYQGGAIYVTMSSTVKGSYIPSNPTITISYTNFTSNSATYGGAIYVSGVDYLELISCKFDSNTAKNYDSTYQTGGVGGALYYDSSDAISQVVFESGNNFTSNTAESSGGAIFWNYNQPENISEVSFSSNSATLYGDDYGCFAQALNSITEAEYNSAISGRRNLGTLSGSTSLTLSEQQSGSSLTSIYLALIDEFDQIVMSDSSSSITLALTGNYSSDTYTPILTGTTTITIENGVVLFDGITFTAEPGSSYKLSFSTTGIDKTKPSNAKYLSDNSLTSTSMSFSIELREWIEGESFQSSGACVQWEEDVEYSLATLSTPGDCKSCQDQRMYCNGGSDIGPKPGYWRSSTSTDNFIAWLYQPACLGYVEPTNNNLGECFTGYQGILWADWEVGFSRTGEHECSKCPNPIWNIIYLILVFLAVIVGIVIMIRSTLAGALQRKNIQSVYIKLLMNHLQLIVLTASFDFSWPDKVLKIFKTTEPVAKVSSQIISFDWFLDQRNSSADQSSQGSNLIRLYYQKMMMYAALPVILALWSYLFWSIYFCKKSRNFRAKKTSRIMATLIILFFLVHPTIVEFMFSNFNCTAIDSEQRVVRDLEVQCWRTEHINYSLMIAIPSLIIWGFGIPLFAWIVLSRNKENLDLIETREKYGFLYNGYKKKYYYWESVNMYRKIAIIFISVFLRVAGVITQALVVFIVLIVFLILNIKLMPFTFRALNDMEMLSIITWMLTIYCGLFFLSDHPEVYNSSDSTVQEADNGLRLDQGSKWFFFFIILFSNILFIAYWAFKMIEEVKNTMRTKMGQLYLYIFLCGNKKRFEEEKRRREIEDENDILKEEFDRQLESIRELYDSGELVLNKTNIQKSAVYLAPKHYMVAIEEKKKLSDEEIKQIKRNKRRFEGQRMHQNLVNDFDAIGPDGREDSNKNKTEDDLTGNLKFEDKLNQFLGLPHIVSIHRKSSNDKSITIDEEDEDNGLNEYTVSSNQIHDSYLLPREEIKMKSKQAIIIDNLNDSKNGGSLIQSPTSSCNMNDNNTIKAKTPLERTVTQDAEELDIIPHNFNDGLKRAKSDDKNIEEGKNGLLVPKSDGSKKRKKSISQGNRTIHEESSSDTSDDDEVYAKRKQEYFQQERLFKRRHKPDEKSTSMINKDNITSFTRIKRIENIQENKQKRQERLKNTELIVDLEEDDFFGQQLSANTEIEGSREKMLENLEGVDEIKESEPEIDDFEESLDERVDF